MRIVYGDGKPRQETPSDDTHTCNVNMESKPDPRKINVEYKIWISTHHLHKSRRQLYQPLKLNSKQTAKCTIVTYYSRTVLVQFGQSCGPETNAKIDQRAHFSLTQLIKFGHWPALAFELENNEALPQKWNHHSALSSCQHSLKQSCAVLFQSCAGNYTALAEF